MNLERTEALAKLAQQGSERAFALLTAHFHPQLVAFVHSRLPESKRSHTEDIVQRTTVQAWRSLSQLQNPRAFKSWLFKTARRQAVNYLELRSVRPILPEDPATLSKLVASLRARSGGGDNLALLKKVWETAKKTMTQKQLRVLELHYKEGMTQKQIAEKERMPLGTVKSLIRKGVLKLQKALNPKK